MRKLLTSCGVLLLLHHLRIFLSSLWSFEDKDCLVCRMLWTERCIVLQSQTSCKVNQLLGYHTWVAGALSHLWFDLFQSLGWHAEQSFDTCSLSSLESKGLSTETSRLNRKDRSSLHDVSFADDSSHNSRGRIYHRGSKPGIFSRSCTTLLSSWTKSD